MTGASPLLVATQVAKRVFGGGRPRQILAPVSLRLLPGEWLTLRGSSGAGKSTLLRIVGACDRDYDGSVQLAGQELRSLRESQRVQLRRRQLGYLFQEGNLVGHLSALDNVLLPALFAGSAALRPRALALLEELQLAALAAQPARLLSGGEQQRLALARALLLQPPLLLCDEPTAGLDAATAQAVVALLQRCRQAGSSLLVATHDATLAGAADRQLELAAAGDPWGPAPQPAATPDGR